MPQPATMPPDHARVERPIVFQLLRDDLHERWSLTGLAAALDIERSALESALERLQKHGIVVTGGDAIGAAPAARRLDALGVIGI
jgi:hypothetical protein